MADSNTTHQPTHIILDNEPEDGLTIVGPDGTVYRAIKGRWYMIGRHVEREVESTDGKS